MTVEGGEAGDLRLENDPTHQDARGPPAIFQTSAGEYLVAVEFVVTRWRRLGVAADSNGLFHGMGTTPRIRFRWTPITDQQTKVFSNQIPLDAVQSMQVIAGAPRPNTATRPA